MVPHVDFNRNPYVPPNVNCQFSFYLQFTGSCSGQVSISYQTINAETEPKQASAGYIAASNHPVCFRRRSEKMESKGHTNSHVLIFGLSFNLILTLGSLGFTCYSLHRLDSRVTAVEQNLLLTNPPYQLVNRVFVTPTSTLPRRSGSQMKENVVSI